MRFTEIADPEDQLALWRLIALRNAVAQRVGEIPQTIQKTGF